MINNKYYIGFQGEPEILFYFKDNDNEKVGFRIWIGYFEYLLGASVSNTIVTGGIIENFVNQEGWYDESPWRIQNSQKAILELGQFNVDNVESKEESIIRILPELQKDMVTLLENSNQNNKILYIAYE